jgi:acetyl-CoA carboxylase biotin carboxyl carrier protein
MSEIREVTAQIPGTFYTRESPTSPAYVSVGGSVSAGDTIGLIEVMKMFNPVVSDYSGTVVEVCLESEDPVDVGDVLIRIEEV